MRVIFEELDREYFFEIILGAKDLEQIQALDGIIGDFIWEDKGAINMNIFIRKEKERQICHSLKEAKLVLEKDFQKTSEEKWKQANHKSKPSQSPTPKLAEAKEPLQRKRRKRSN